MKFNIKISSSLISAMILLSTGCSKFEDINTNPDATEKVNASLLATNIILKNLKFNGRDAKAYLDENAQSKYIALANESMIRSQYNDLGAAGFDNMTMLPNIESMLKYAEGSTMENSYKALAKFSRAYMFYDISMKVGDIPYSKTGGGQTGVTKVPFDTQEQVMTGILDDLKEAAALFASGIKFDGDPTPYNGDPAKWRRATNAFALRVLLSLSKKSEASTINIKNRFQEIVTENFLLENNTGYLGLKYSSLNLHPMAGTNDLFTSRTDVSKTIIDNLKLLNNDRRLFYYADPSKAKIASGLNEANPNAYVGVDVSDSYDDITTAHLSNTYSLINSRYLKVVDSDPRMMMTYAEQQFILSEARLLNWISTGNAKDYYESGVKAALTDIMNTNSSYAHGMAINQSYIDGYFTGEAAFKSTTSEQLKQIWLQKYLMNFMVNPIQSFYEYRRTGYPTFPINPATSLNITNKNAIPVRWLYPSSEYNYNKDNLISALNSQYSGIDDINNKMWLLK
ncbi:MAG: SusD/RagB family nutrient-binding outer membrane lipoprotein [Chitinophagaceae bacterium]|nr:MAG: SusD/RagB family nutrient-binding outer membrane lipoprotein [Chitinophagaceae bacterium]